VNILMVLNVVITFEKNIEKRQIYLYFYVVINFVHIVLCTSNTFQAMIYKYP
jgi:hypothetical protein